MYIYCPETKGLTLDETAFWAHSHSYYLRHLSDIFISADSHLTHRWLARLIIPSWCNVTLILYATERLFDGEYAIKELEKHAQECVDAEGGEHVDQSGTNSAMS